MADRVVLLDPDATSATELAQVLTGAGFTVDVASDGREALDLAARWQPDVVVVDVGAPGIDGLGTVEKLPVDPRTRAAWVIVLTPPGLSQAELQVVTARAHDHLSRPIAVSDLVVRVRAGLDRGRALRELSPLTGLPGRFRLAAELEWLTSLPEPRFALLFLDLDGFGPYNERYGSASGNEVIRAVAELLADAQAHHRAETTFAAHFGGDDFAVVTSPEQADPLARWLVGGFDLLAPSLYAEEDRARGYIEVLDRRAATQRHPLMTISIGVVSTARRELANQYDAISVATEMLRVARGSAGSSFAIDRRRRG